MRGMDPEVTLRSRLAHAEGKIEGMEEMLEDHVVVSRSELETIRLLIEVHSPDRIKQARWRLRALLGMDA